MAESNDNDDLRRANFRLCRLCTWTNYGGLGFNLENSIPPPHVIRTVESNSPASAGGLKILDLILAVNNQDVSEADYKTVTQAIKDARDSNNRIELLVIEKRFYEPLKNKGISFNPIYAKSIETPTTMPRDYMNFPKYTPRTCDIHLGRNDETFGFEVVNGVRDIGAFIQEVVPNSPASRTPLRKSDRILEIDDKFVDNEPGRMILEKLHKAKKKRAVKLYVVDTNTYKYFQENKTPLTSKEFRKSKFAKQQQQPISTYINVEDVSNEPKTTDVDIPRPSFPTPTFRDNQQLNKPENLSTRELRQDDIRLCTIARANATDTYGIELNYHKRDQYHSLKLPLDGGSSNAALAGVKLNDHLIEINGENIEHIGDTEVKQRIRAIKYPQPLKLLVADSATYNYYKQQNKVIHSGLPSVKKLPENPINQSVSFVSSYREPSMEAPSTITSLPIEEPSSVIAALVNTSLTPGRTSTESLQLNRRQYQLQRIPGFSGYGFSVNSNQAANIAHKISQIAPNSPAAHQGLRVGDYILTVNNTNVEKMSASDFKQFLGTSAQNAQGNPLLLEVINEESYRPSTLPDVSLPRHSTTEPPPSIISVKETTTTESSYYKHPQPTPPRDISRKSTVNQPPPSQEASHKSTMNQPPPSQEGSRKLTTTQRTSSRDESQKSAPTQPISSQNGSRKLTTTQPYMNGYDSPSRDQYSRPEIRPSTTASISSLSRSREHLSRGAVDVVSKNRLLRYCRLNIGPGQVYGFQLKSDNNKHIVYNIQPDSPAARAGLNENDHLIEVDDQDIENKSNKEIASLIRNATHNGTLRLFIAPNSVKVLSRRSGKSLSELNDNHYSRDTKSRSKQPSTGRTGSVSRLNGQQNNENHPYGINNSSDPTEPLPRKCVLQHDPSYRGCGFRLIEKDNCDTPIIVEISPNSPAKRSGLTEGDHIIYIDSQNVQNFRSFNDIIYLIQRTFEENGQITFVTLTGPGYQVLKRRGGYLETNTFDYQSPNINQLKPRLCKLKLYNYENDFGFTLSRNNYLYIKTIEKDSPADLYGLKKDDIVLELNGKIEKYLTLNQIKEIIDISKQERKLDILVIDNDGYQFSQKHAIPLNSLLSFVQTKDGQTTTTRIQQEPVYL